MPTVDHIFNPFQHDEANMVILSDSAVDELDHERHHIKRSEHRHAIVSDEDMKALRRKHGKSKDIVVKEVSGAGTVSYWYVVSRSDHKATMQMVDEAEERADHHAKLVTAGHLVQETGTKDGKHYAIVGDDWDDKGSLSLLWIDDDGNTTPGDLSEVS